MAVVDVLLPFHRVDNFLVEAVQSVQMQNGVSTRVILIDDRSISARAVSVSFLLRRQDVLISTSGNVGYGKALSAGTRAADADVVALMNSDDVSMPTRFRKQLAQLETSEICIAKMEKFSGGKTLASVFGELQLQHYEPSFLLLGSYGADASWVSRADWWRTQTFFDNLPSLDWRIALRTFPNTSVSSVPTIQYRYRQHRSQVTRNGVNSDVRSAVHADWANLNRMLGLPEVSNATFSVLAVPWESPKSTPCATELQEWAGKFLRRLNPEALEDAKRIIARRYVRGAWAARSELSTSARFLWSGRMESVAMTLDLLRNFSLSR